MKFETVEFGQNDLAIFLLCTSRAAQNKLIIEYFCLCSSSRA